MSALAEKALDAAKEYIDLVVKEPLTQLGGILSDSIGYWRLKNRVNLILRAKKLMDSKGVSPQKIGPSNLVSILEEGSLVDEENLAGMFAALLANQLDPKQQEKVHPSYAKVLAQLSSLDATVLTTFRKFISSEAARDVGLRGGGLMVEFVAKDCSIANKPCYLSCLNLWRLGLIDHCGFGWPETHPIANLFQDSAEHQKFRITEYGLHFLAGCDYGTHI